MRILSEFTYVAENTERLINHSISGSYSSKLGIIKFINNNQKAVFEPFQFPEITIKFDKAFIIFPNILITKDNDLINTNNGYTTIELINHKVSGYPITRQDDQILISRPLNKIDIKKGVYLVAANNFSSFLLGEIPRLEKYSKFLDLGYPVILHGECLPFHIELLNMLGITEDKIIKVSKETSININEVIHSTPTYFHNSSSYDSIRFLRKNFFKFINNHDKKSYDKIYLSRSNLGANSDRYISNEKELECFLKEFGFIIKYPEELTVIDQFQIFHFSNLLISPFGATWASIIFRKENAKSLILATKLSPEFARISTFLDQQLFAMTLTPKKSRNGKNFSQSHDFTITKSELDNIKQFILS